MNKYRNIKWMLSGDIIFSLIGVTLMFFYFYDVYYRAKEYESLMLTLVFVFSIVCFIVITYQRYRLAKSAQDEEQKAGGGVTFKEIFSKKQLKMVLAIALYLPAMRYLGFVISTFIFLMFMQTMLELPSKRKIIFISLGAAILLDLIFVQFLQIKLPSGLMNISSGVFSKW